MSEMFLAEAAVAVVPDLTAFRARLIKDLETATAGVVANVKVAATGATTAASQAATATKSASQTAGVTNNAAAQAARAQTQVLAKQTAAARALELAERRTLATSSEVAASRIRLTAATRAVVLQEDAFAAALRTNSGATITAAANELGLARAHEQAALAALKAAGSEDDLRRKREAGAAAAASRAQFTIRGFGAQALAAAGLRGATLAANSAFLAGTVAAVGFFKSVQSAAALESQLNVFKVTVGATADEMARVSDEAKRLGSDITLPGVDAGDAAEAFTELGKAGLGVQDSMDGARGVLQLATAAAIDNATATQIAASALNAFGLAGTEAVHVADVLANAANESQGSIADVGLSLQQAAAVARQVGVSFETTVAFLTLLARNGIRGSDAGTSLRVAFTKLINPTDKAREVLERLNVQLRDASGNIRPEVFSDFANAQRDLSRAQQDANAGIVFGTDALRAYSIISREGVAGLNEVQGALARQGSAAELAGARMAGLEGDLENLKNQLSTLGITVGEVLIPALSDLATGLGQAVSGINAALSPIAGLVKGAFDLKDSLSEAFTVNIAGVEVGAKNLTQILGTTRLLADAAGRVGDVFINSGEDIKFARAQAVGLLTELNRTGGATAVNETVVALQEMQKEFAAGDESAKAFARDLQVIIDRILTASSNDQIDLGELHVDIPPDLLNGEPGAIAGRAAKRAFQREFRFEPSDDFGFGALLQGLEAQAKDSASRMDDLFADTARKAAQRAREAVASSTGALNVLEGQALGIETGGGSTAAKRQRLIANARARQAAARDLIEAERLQLKPGQKSSPDLRAAQAQLKQAQDDENGILEDIENDAKQAADERERRAREIQAEADKADRAVLDAISRREGQRFNAREIRVGNTKRLQDDRQLALDQAAFYTAQIEVVKKSVKDAQTRADALDNLRQQRRLALDRARDIQVQMAQDAQTAAGTLTERLQLRLQIAEARGGKDAILAALDALIANAERQVRAAKKGTLKLLEAQLALAELNKQKRELLKEAADEAAEKRGPTAFDLLTQFSGIFGDTAGNLIGGAQPFQTAGGINGFTADIAQHLKRTGAGGKSLGSAAAQFQAGLKLKDEPLVGALGAATGAVTGLTNAILGRSSDPRGRTSTATRAGTDSGAIARNDNRWREASRARSAVDNRRGGI